MNVIDRILQEFNKLPGIMKVAGLAIIAIVSFVIINDKIWSLASKWNQEADALQQVIDDSVRRAKEPDEPQKRLVSVVGPVLPPRDEASGSQAMATVIHDIIKSHGNAVTNFTYSASAASKLPREALSSLADVPGQRFDRLRADLRFDSNTEIASLIIAAIESRPEIESIVSVRIVRHDVAPKVTVTLTVEAWVRSSNVERRRGGAV